MNKGKLIIPGSTIITQMKKLESEKEKGIVILDSLSEKTEFIPLKEQRKLFYEKISFENASIDEVKGKLKERIEFFLKENNSGLKPLIRIKLAGSLALGVNPSDVELNEIIREFDGKAIFSIEKTFSIASFKKKIKELRESQKDRQSIALLGINLVEKNLEATSFDNAFDVKRVFDLLAEDETEKVIELCSESNEKEKQKEEKDKPKLSDFL